MGTDDTLSEVKAEIAEIRSRVDRLIWAAALGFVATGVLLAVFRYVG